MNLRRPLEIAQALTASTLATYFSYRAEMAMWVLAGTLPLFLMLVWMQLAESGAVAGFTPAGFAAYFLSAFFVRHMTPFLAVRELDRQIRLGGLAADLLQPLDPYWRSLTDQIVDALYRLPVVLPIVGIGLAITGGWTAFRPESPWLVTLALLGAMALHFHLMYCLGLVAFWSEKSVALEELYGTGYFVFGGGFMPVGLMPAAVTGVLAWTPFPYIIDLPVEALLGRSSGPALQSALLHQWSWVLLLVWLSRVLWHRGLRRYDAAGL
jgi:ABC-2 type transport system permease protein